VTKDEARTSRVKFGVSVFAVYDENHEVKEWVIWKIIGHTTRIERARTLEQATEQFLIRYGGQIDDK